MAEEVVATHILSEEMIRAGARLVDHLDKAHFPVDAALWLYRAEAERWRLLIATPGVKSVGPRNAYTWVRSILSTTPEGEPRLGTQDISVVDDQDPLISLLRRAVRTRSGIRLSRSTIMGIYVEDAYIYRLDQ